MPGDPPDTSSADPRVTRTRSRVLAAAWEVLTEVGFDRVTIELVSERSGVARSTMYRHWATREEILRDAFSAQATHEPVGDDDGARDARSALLAYTVAMAAGIADDWGRAAATLSARALDQPDERRAVRTFTDGTHADLREIVQRAATEGRLAHGADVEETTVALVDLVIAPLFYRFLFLGEPAGAEHARALAHRGWSAIANDTRADRTPT